MTELSSEDRALLDGILKRVRRFDETLGRYYSEGLWMRMDRLYHGFTDFKRSLQGVYGAAREDLYRDARKEFGHELRIPYAFAIVETVLPALLSNRPRILVLPQDGQSERNVQNMKATIDAQQERIDLELKLQAVVKSGLMYGLGVGKGLALDTPLPTPTGWTTMGDVRPGDRLLDEDGRPCRVEWVSPTHDLPCFEVKFDDGSAITCDSEHLWTTLGLTTRKRIGEAAPSVDWRDHWDRTDTMAVGKLAERVEALSGQRWHTVPNARALDLPPRQLPVDPYILGAWLGDGVTVHGAITTMDRTLVDEIEARGQTAKMRASTATKTAPTYQFAGLTKHLRAARVFGAKHIPAPYLRASREQRLDLLRGLMDTDGFVVRHGSVGIDLCDRRLAADVAELVRTMGWAAHVSEGATCGPWATPGGRRYRLYFTPDACPFLLERKIAQWRPSKQAVRATGRRIVAVTEVPRVPTRCLSVNSPRHLFLAGRDMVPTHNSYWLRQEGQKPVVSELSRLHPARMAYALTGGAQGSQYGVSQVACPLFDDPTFEPIPVRDFGWDTFGSSIENCRCAWHRTWRDTAYVKDRLSDPLGWSHMQLTLEDIEMGGASAQLYRTAMQPQFEAQGVPLPDPREAIHEVLEYHDRGQIVTVLDRRWIVRVIPNETWYGRLPFPIYRPTEVLNQMVGKGEIEPGEDMFGEMDQIRTDRRWAALMRLNPPLFYQEGVVDPDQIRVGPGEMNGVNGDPHELIWALETGDVPGSSYRETAEIAADIVRMSGISDVFAGGDAQGTATGVQLQLARASARIQLKTRRAEIELIKPIGDHWLALNQRHILENRTVRTPAPPVPGEPERHWAYYTVGPAELAGDFDIEIEGGSTQPENVPQKRQDAQFWLALLGSPAGQSLLDAREAMVKLLENLDVKNPEAMLSAGQPIPPETLDLIAQHLAELGVDPNAAQQLVAGSLQEAMQQRAEAVSGAGHGDQPSPSGPEQPPEQPPQ